MQASQAQHLQQDVQKLIEKAQPFLLITGVCNLCITEKYHTIFNPEAATLLDKSQSLGINCQAQLQLQLQLSWKLSLALFSNSPTDKRRHFTDKRRHFTDKRRHFTYKLRHFIPTEKLLETYLIKKPLLQNVATMSSRDEQYYRLSISMAINFQYHYRSELINSNPLQELSCKSVTPRTNS